MLTLCIPAWIVRVEAIYVFMPKSVCPNNQKLSCCFNVCTSLGITVTGLFGKGLFDRWNAMLVAHLLSKHKCVTLPIFLANLTCVGLLLLLLLLYWIKHAEFSAAVPFKAKATNRTNIKAKTISNMFAYITPCKYFGMIQFVQMPIWYIYIYVYTVE